MLQPTASQNKCRILGDDHWTMKKKPRKRSYSGSSPSSFKWTVVSVLMSMTYSLLVISALIVRVESITVEKNIGAGDLYDSDGSDRSYTSIQSSKAPLPPMIKKCCPFDYRYELDPDGLNGRCVPSVSIEGPSMSMSMNTVGTDDGHTVRHWKVPTDGSGSIEEETTGEAVPDREDTQSTTQVPLEDGLVPVRANRSSRQDYGLNDTDTVNILSNGGPTPVTFRLNVGYPDCSAINMVRKIIHRTKLGERDTEYDAPPPPSSDPRPTDAASNDTDAGPLEMFTVLTANGTLMWVDDKGMMNTRRSQDFCIDQLDETHYIALICKPLCNDLSPCIRKCCPPDKILDLVSEHCVKAVRPWTPYLYTPKYEQINTASDLQLHRSEDYHYTYGIPRCVPYLMSLREDPLDKMYALMNGTLLTINRGFKIFHPPDTYCIDGTNNYEPGGETIIAGPNYEPVPYSGLELDQVAIVCLPATGTDQKDPRKLLPWRFTMFAVAEFITAFFLFLTAIVYIILWEQQNIHGWLQFAYVVSCFQSYTCLGILQLKSEDINTYSPKLCEAMGSVIHFSFLAAFFWMTSMNFDLWWTFSGCSPMRPRSKVGEIRRFLLFAVFSWGCSGIIAGTGLVLDHKYSDDPESTVIRPHFGENFCYFDNDVSHLYYFYAPLGILLIINLLFFFSTIFSLHRLQKVTKFATEQSSKSETRKFLLFIKLFVVMGVLWIFEVIGWAVVTNAEGTERKELWMKVFLPTDILNSSQGVLIFIIFTCKTNTCRQIEGQLKKFTLVLQQNRDKGYGSTILSHIKGGLVIMFASVTLPIVHLFRIVLNYFGRVCGRKVLAGDTSGKTISSNATIVTTSSMFDKSRKVSDCSVTTTISSVPPGREDREGHYPTTSSSNNSSITNIEMDMTSIVSLKT